MQLSESASASIEIPELFRNVRRQTTALVRPLSAEDMMLQSMEDAAKRARLASNGTAAPEPAPRPTPAVEAEESLPTIPVFKKSTVEVYRRASDGSMQRVKR